MIRMRVAIIMLLTVTAACPARASEVIPESSAEVIVREHPKTGKPYVVITSTGSADRDPFSGKHLKAQRPDYRMLDPKMKSGQIPYEGPYSSRKKVYILAATLATVGTVGGTAIIAAAPAATGAGAAGGAGAYGAAGGAVAAGTISTAALQTRSDPEKDNYSLTSESALLKSGEDLSASQ